MTIVVTGGGSGGHITPILAVAAEIKRISPDTSVVFIGPKGSSLLDIPDSDPNIDSSYVVPAGKFRRYHGEGIAQLFDYKTQYLNAKDLFRTINGLRESWTLLGKIKPSVVFTRGGFVSVPVATAAWLRKIPYITHDSDALPSLANRIIGPKAAKNAVALEPAIYPYAMEKMVRVGIPISASYQAVDVKTMQKYRDELGLSKYKKVICVTGGGNGAEPLNRLFKDNVSYLLDRYPDLAVVHIAGRTLAEKLSEDYDTLLSAKTRNRVIVKDFVSDLYRYSGAADVIVARGGATNLAEFAAQKKACIIIPSKHLIWNVKITESLAKEQAVIGLSEDQAEQELRLANTIIDLLDHKQKREALSKKFAHFYIPDASTKIAELILEQAK